MKSVKSPILLSFLILFFLSTCKKEDANSPASSGDEESVYQLHQKIEEATDIIFDLGEKNNYNPYQAMGAACQKLLDDPAIEKVQMVDSAYLYITMNGLTQTLHLNAVDEDGQSLYRGSKNGQGPLGRNKKEDFVLCQNTMKNNKVLCVVAELEDFYFNDRKVYKSMVIDKLEGAGLDLEVTAKYAEECTFEILSTLDEYGLVIIETHGLPDGFYMSKWQTKETIDNLDDLKSLFLQFNSNEAWNLLLTGDLALGNSFKVNPNDNAWWTKDKETFSQNFSSSTQITSKMIRSLNIDLSETILLGNMCYSGYNSSFLWNPFKKENTGNVDPIKPAFLTKNPLAYYHYSNVNYAGVEVAFEVSDKFAKQCEDSLIKSFFYDQDSTLNAHLFANTSIGIDKPYRDDHPLRATYDYFNLFNFVGKTNWCYGCGTFTDPRDQEVYNLACIDDQLWFAQNLRYNAAGSIAPNNDETNTKYYGRLYEYGTLIPGRGRGQQGQEGIQGICPDGWHIPSRYDWKKLFASLEIPYDNYGGTKDEESDSAGTKLRDSKGFSSQFAGEAGKRVTESVAEIDYRYFEEAVTYWSCTPLEEWKERSVGHISVYKNSEVLTTRSSFIDDDRLFDSYYSCRCVKDE